jgi:chromosome partitioning protein
MCKVICIVSPEKGSGKTATAVNLAACLAIFEKKTLLIDCDYQCNATRIIGGDAREENGLYSILRQEKTGNAVISHTGLEFLKFISASSDLTMCDHDFFSRPENEMLLSRLVMDQADDFDYIVFDTPPNLDPITISAMTASDWLVIPLQCREYTEGEGNQPLVTVLEKNENEQNVRGSRNVGILFTFCENNEDVDNFLPSDLLERFNPIIFSATIPYDKNMEESGSDGKPFVLDDIMSKASQAYLDFTGEILSQMDSQPSDGELDPQAREEIARMTSKIAGLIKDINES